MYSPVPAVVAACASSPACGISLPVQAILAHLARSRPPTGGSRPTRARRTHVARSSVLLSMLPLSPGGGAPASNSGCQAAARTGSRISPTRVARRGTEGAAFVRPLRLRELFADTRDAHNRIPFGRPVAASSSD
jgi:hypothetical protein